MIQTVSLKLVQIGNWKVLGDLLATTGSANTGLLGKTFLGLFIAPFSGFSLGLSGPNIAEANYAGYARVAATWSARGIDPTGRPEVFSQATLWNPTGNTPVNTILGMALWDALTGGNLFGIGVLPTPIQLGSTMDQANLTARFQIPLDPADWGQQSLTN